MFPAEARPEMEPPEGTGSAAGTPARAVARFEEGFLPAVLVATLYKLTDAPLEPFPETGDAPVWGIAARREGEC